MMTSGKKVIETKTTLIGVLSQFLGRLKKSREDHMITQTNTLENKKDKTNLENFKVHLSDYLSHQNCRPEMRIWKMWDELTKVLENFQVKLDSLVVKKFPKKEDIRDTDTKDAVPLREYWKNEK